MNTQHVTGQSLAKILDVSPSRISQAARNGEYVKGYPIEDWALYGDTGQVKGYEIPEFLITDGPERPADHYDSSPSFSLDSQVRNHRAEATVKTRLTEKDRENNAGNKDTKGITKLSDLSLPKSQLKPKQDAGGVLESLATAGAILGGVWLPSKIFESGAQTIQGAANFAAKTPGRGQY